MLERTFYNIWNSHWIFSKNKRLHNHIKHLVWRLLCTGFVQKTRPKNQGLFKDFPAPNNFIPGPFNFIESALNIAMQKWVLHKQDTL